MTEKELIGKIRELRQIRPSKDWVVLTKSQILGQEEKKRIPIFFPIFRMVYAGLVVVFMFFGLFVLSQNSLPGDLLYPIKKISERTQAVFVSETDKPKASLELANKKLEELNQVVQKNEIEKLAPAIKEVKISVTQAAKNLVKSKKVDKKIIEKSLELARNKEIVEKSLGVEIGNRETEESLNDIYQTQAEIVIKNLEESTLTEKQEELLAQMKELVEAKRYSEALELYLVNQ